MMQQPPQPSIRGHYMMRDLPWGVGRLYFTAPRAIIRIAFRILQGRPRMRRIITSIAVVLWLAVSTHAQPLVDRVPENSIFYLGWCGSESMPSEFQGSHLKAVLDSSNLPQVFNEFVPQLMAKAAMQDRDVAEAMDYLRGLAGPMWRHPTALYFTGIDFTGPMPMPRVGLICDAGNDLQGMVDRLTAIKQKAGADFPINWKVDNKTLTVFVGAQPDAPGKGLSGNATFKSALAKVQPNAAVALYIDGAKALAVIDEAVAKSNDRGAMTMWPKIRDGAGLGGLGSIIWTSGFDGKEWGDQLFVAAPAPRKGLLAWGDAPPINDALLKTIPGTATYLSAGAFDVAGCISSIRSIVGAVDPRAQTEFDGALGQVNVMLGMDLMKDVLEPLGPQWVVYTDPNTAGIGLVGLVIVNKPDDPAKAEKGLNAIAGLIASASAQAMRREGLSIPYRQTKVGDLTVNYIAAPLVSPAWTVKDGNLYLGLYPQVVASAARFSGSGKPSIVDNADFQAMRKRLGGTNVTALTYGDLRKTAPESYQILLLVSRLGLGIADMWGVKAPELVVPTLDDLMKNLTPMGSVAWADQDGYHMRSVRPFPGSELMSGGAGIIAPMIGASAVMTGITLPSLSRARETANRVKCASNQRQIAQAMMLHSNENRGQYPQKLGELLKHGLSVDVFVCPSHGTEVPPHIRRADPETQAAWVNTNSDYVYLGAGKTNRAPGDQVLLYEKFEAHGNDGINMTYGDGHVEFQPMRNVLRELERSGVQAPQ
jgi:prepilin-type processing-associated H-X9-DG protein